MTYHLFYFLSSSRFDHAEEIFATDDADAIGQAQCRTGWLALELWCDGRRVEGFAAEQLREAAE